MPRDKPPQDLEKARLQIARKVRELRTERRWTQAELAARLQLSQNYLRELERGTGSFTAEQLLKILSLFNVPATHFAPQGRSHESDLQNALARLGALHLHETADVVPSEQFEEVENVVLETLASQSPRQLTALAPVLVSNIDRLSLPRLQQKLIEVGLDRRLGWLVDNAVEALHRELKASASGPWTQPYRRAELVLGVLLESLVARFPAWVEGSVPDLLDPTVDRQTLEEVRAASSSISKRWGVVTSLQPQDFADALRAARADP
jgi:transcriptional regulator with XRE-family HTH domain